MTKTDHKPHTAPDQKHDQNPDQNHGQNHAPDHNEVDTLQKLSHIHIAQEASQYITPERLHEQNVAIYDLLDENQFAVKGQTGPYHLYLKTDMRHIYFDVRDVHETVLSVFGMALGPFRRIIREYNLICTSYYEAIRTKSPSQIQAIDMGRRGLHNEGAELLLQRLSNYVVLDDATSRRLFTLVFVMTSR